MNREFDLPRLVQEIGDCLVGLSLIDADATLDEARRFVWSQRFAGDDHETIKEYLKPSDVALKVIAILTPLAILEVEHVAFNLRNHLYVSTFYVSTFAVIPGSAFAQSFLTKTDAPQPKKNARAHPKLAVVGGKSVH